VRMALPRVMEVDGRNMVPLSMPEYAPGYKSFLPRGNSRSP
jgi:hypothetical protein